MGNSSSPEKHGRGKEQQYHFARMMSNEASPEQKIMAAQAYADGKATDAELDSIHSLYLHEKYTPLRSALLRILVIRASHRQQVQKLISELCDPSNEGESTMIPVVADTLSSIDWRSDQVDIYKLIAAFRTLLRCIDHPQPQAVESAVISLCHFDDQLVESDDDQKSKNLRVEYFNMFGPDEHAKLRKLMFESESGWTRYACAELLDRTGEELPEEWAGIVKSAQLQEDLNAETLEDTFESTWKYISQINKYRPFETSLSDEQIALLDREVREAPKPLELLQIFSDSGARIILVQCQHMPGEGIKRVAQEICALREHAGLTHFALPIDIKLETSLHRFVNGEVAEYLREFFEDVNPDHLDPGLSAVEAIKAYREALRSIRDAGVKIVLYGGFQAGIHTQGENAFDRKARILLDPIKQGGKMLVYHDEYEDFSVSRVPLTDKHAKMKLSLAPVLHRELDQGEGAVVSVLQQTQEEMISQSEMMKMHNLDRFFSRSSFSGDVGLRLGSSQLDSLRFYEFTRERFKEAWHAFFVRVDDESGDHKKEDIPDIPEPAHPPAPSPLLAYIDA